MAQRIVPLILVTSGYTTVTLEDTNVLRPDITYISDSRELSVVSNTAAKLLILCPGETHKPGTYAGKTGTPTTQTAGKTFMATCCGTDAWYNITSTNAIVRFSCDDPYDRYSGNDYIDLSLSAGTTYYPALLRTVNDSVNGTYWAPKVEGFLGSVVRSSTSTVKLMPNSDDNKLQLLFPGETAVPGKWDVSPNGKNGSPNPLTAGIAFTFTVNSVDNQWNKIIENLPVFPLSNRPE